MKASRLKTILLGSGAAIALLATVATSAVARDRETGARAELDRQLQVLVKRLERLEAKRATAGALRRRAVPAAAVEAGSKPRTWKLPGTNTSMQVGGFAQLDLIYDINHFSGDGLSSNGASGASFPSKGTAAANRQGNFRLHARKSRFFIKTWTPTDWGELATHIEGDFFGAGGNQLVSNSNSFRLRHAYGRLGPVLAGQTYPTFRFTKFEMSTWEDRGIAGNGNGRQGQIRYHHSFGGGTMVLVAVENPETGRAVTSATYTAPVVISAGGANDPTPDFVAAIQHRWANGRVKFGVVIGTHNMDDGAGSSDMDLMWAVQGGVRIRFNNKKTTVALLGFFGDGAGHYFRGMPGNIAVVGTSGANVKVHSIRHFGGYAWIKHNWSKSFSTNLGFGRHDANVENYMPKGVTPARTLDIHWSIIANFVWSPVKNVTMGVEYHFVKSQFHNARSSTVNRIQASARYKF